MSAKSILKDVQRRRIMPLNQQERMKAEIAQDHADMRGDFPEVSRSMKKQLMKHPDHNPEKALVNVQALKRKIHALKLGQHPELNKTEIIALEKRKKFLVEWIKKKMVPVEDVRMQPSVGGVANSDFGRAANGMARGEFSQEYMENANELQNILRLLEKDNPNAGNLERFRPKTGEMGSQ